jgi:hypothetical protein
MKKLLALGLVFGPLTALVIACATPAVDGGTGGSTSDLSGSIGDERACAAARAYDAAQVSDFSTPADADLPPAVLNATAGASAISEFSVDGIGDVYAAQAGGATKLVDRNGRLLAQGAPSNEHMVWGGLHCGSSAIDGGHTSGGEGGASSGWGGGEGGIVWGGGEGGSRGAAAKVALEAANSTPTDPPPIGAILPIVRSKGNDS